MTKQHIHWLLPGQYNDLKSLKDNSLASVRLRAYVSSLNTKFFTFSFGEDMPLNTNILVVGKIGNFNLEKRSFNWLNQIKMATYSNSKVIIDYTDNHLMINSPMTNFYRAILPFITLAVTPSEKMSSIFSNFWKGTVHTIYDSIDVDILECKNFKSKKLLWFGHATNIPYLLNFLNKNYSLIENYSLHIITNQNGIDYFNNRNKTNIQSKTKLWSTNILTNEAKLCDMCIIPSDKENVQKQGAGHNRLITSLALGLPTIATMLPSYAKFKDYFIDIDTKEISDVLKDPNIIKNKVISAQKNVVPLFNKFNLSKKWLKLFNQ